MAIARTIIHEAIHAYTLSYIDSPTEEFQKEFPEFWDDYVAKKYGDINSEDGWNKYHHEEMARNYVDVISDALADWDDKKQDLNYYKDLAWGGLLGTKVFDSMKDLSDTDRLRIKKLNFAEDINTSDAKGSPCNKSN